MADGIETRRRTEASTTTASGGTAGQGAAPLGNDRLCEEGRVGMSATRIGGSTARR